MKVFILGDSRTGTTSVHEFLSRSGLRSVHHFPDEAGMIEPLYTRRSANWLRLQHFIENSGYEVFSDYPTRAFFREICAAYPDAYFILTLRRNLKKWRRSMKVLLGAKLEDLDLLQACYLCYNEEIRCSVIEHNLRFLQIHIEDDSRENAEKLNGFLGLPWNGPLLRLNTSHELRGLEEPLWLLWRHRQSYSQFMDVLRMRLRKRVSRAR